MPSLLKRKKTAKRKRSAARKKRASKTPELAATASPGAVARIMGARLGGTPSSTDSEVSAKHAGAVPTTSSVRRKPMARANRVSLFHREVRTTLSSAAIDILFGQALVISEGQFEQGNFFGSTMITIDCAKASDWVSDHCDATTVRQVAELVLRDERFRERVRDLGEQEATRLARSPLESVEVEMRLRSSGNHLHVDVDVEATHSQVRAS